MERKKYKSTTRAKNRWNGENYDRLYPYVQRGKKAVYLKAAEVAALESLNELIESAADEWTMRILRLTPDEFDAAVKEAAEEERRKRSKTTEDE